MKHLLTALLLVGWPGWVLAQTRLDSTFRILHRGEEFVQAVMLRCDEDLDNTETNPAGVDCAATDFSVALDCRGFTSISVLASEYEGVANENLNGINVFNCHTLGAATDFTVVPGPPTDPDDPIGWCAQLSADPGCGTNAFDEDAIGGATSASIGCAEFGNALDHIIVQLDDCGTGLAPAGGDECGDATIIVTCSR